MYSLTLDKIETITSVFHDLIKEEETLGKKTNIAGWKYRNALISHVNSGYCEHAILITHKNLKDELSKQHTVLYELLKFLRLHINLDGYFPKYKEMLNEFDALIDTSIKMEKFEISHVLKTWRDKFPNP
jgi:hypothetical protein